LNSEENVLDEFDEDIDNHPTASNHAYRYREDD
jgi:hypothetical protein